MDATQINNRLNELLAMYRLYADEKFNHEYELVALEKQNKDEEIKIWAEVMSNPDATNEKKREIAFHAIAEKNPILQTNKTNTNIISQKIENNKKNLDIIKMEIRIIELQLLALEVCK